MEDSHPSLSQETHRHLSDGGKKVRKSLGQHYLISPGVVEKIARACLSHAGDNRRVVEIGPGLGALTGKLLELGLKVNAVEIEAESRDILEEKFSGAYPETFRILHRDFMTLRADELSEGDGTYLLAGNLPYNLTSEILFRSLEEHLPHLHAMVYMMQKEVAVRIRNSPGGREYGILSVLLQPYFDISLLVKVAPGSFFPPPKVDSEVLLFVKKKEQPVFKNRALFKSFVRTAFNQRRKQLRAAFRGASLGDWDTVRLEKLWERFPDRASARAESLGWEAFRELAEGYGAL
ncbi:MAG: ribosomal RNA small subunit methyltransferase A [Spirochaetia bacterium]|nr:ribosomal RNA small subunit methyltransferase A [Spirochaetia bacterium]